MWSTRSRPWERQLVAECEAYLSGHYARYLGDNRRAVPPWAWLNILAHGSADELAALGAGSQESPGDTRVWRQALEFLAHEIGIKAAARGQPLTDLQRSTLVPLELELAGRASGPPLDPAQLVASVLRALAERPTNRRRVTIDPAD